MILKGPAVAGAVIALSLTGCAADSTTSDDVTRHAAVAGTVMTQIRGPIPARAAAARVTGRVNDTTITAVALRGTTWGGSVTLRVTVSHHQIDRGPMRTSRCYIYDFAYPRNDDLGQPHSTDCPSTHAIDVDRPALPNGVDTPVFSRVQNALNSLSNTARDDPRRIRTALLAAIGRDYTVTVSRASPHYVWIRYADQCLTAQVSPVATHLDTIRQGDGCFGG